MLEDFPLGISQRLICLVGSMGTRVVMQKQHAFGEESADITPRHLDTWPYRTKLQRLQESNPSCRNFFSNGPKHVAYYWNKMPVILVIMWKKKLTTMHYSLGDPC
jgi:hypothetical protein